jgi:hypothetical protein
MPPGSDFVALALLPTEILIRCAVTWRDVPLRQRRCQQRARAVSLPPASGAPSSATLPSGSGSLKRTFVASALVAAESPESANESSEFLAGRTGLEPAASGVTGRRYNQLNYRPESGGRYIAQASVSSTREKALGVQKNDDWGHGPKTGRKRAGVVDRPARSRVRWGSATFQAG